MASSVAATEVRPIVDCRLRAPRGGTPAASAPEKSPRAGASRRSPRRPHASPYRVTGTATIAAPCARAASIARSMTSAVTNGRAASCTSTMSQSAATAVKRLSHRILPALATGNQPHTVGRAEPRGRGRQDVGRHRDDDLADVGMRGEGLDRALQHRAPAELQQLLRHRTADTPAAATRRDDGGHAHRRWLCGSGQTAHYIAARRSDRPPAS